MIDNTKTLWTPLTAAFGMTLVMLASAGCPSIDRDKSNDPGPADGGETGPPADPDAETEKLEAELVEANKARMSCEAELAECKAPKQ